MKVDRKGIFLTILVEALSDRAQFDVSILVQLRNLLMEPPHQINSPPLQQEDNLRSKKHADVKPVGDRRYEMMKVVDVVMQRYESGDRQSASQECAWRWVNFSDDH
jgi:hypothetical protein